MKFLVLVFVEHTSYNIEKMRLFNTYFRVLLVGVLFGDGSRSNYKMTFTALLKFPLL